MITGDNPLTACHVAKELLFTQKKGGILILTCLDENTKEWAWRSIDETQVFPLEKYTNCDKLTETYDLCVTGDVRFVQFPWIDLSSVIKYRFSFFTGPDVRK